MVESILHSFSSQFRQSLSLHWGLSMLLLGYFASVTVPGFAQPRAGSDTTMPAVLHEPPLLANQVRAGKLPPLAQRLPEKPAITTPVEKIGRYGGTWRRLAAKPGDLLLQSRLGYEPLVRWARDGKTVVPGVAESWETKDNAATFVFHLRKGMRWSDGEPFTSEDFVFSYKEIDSDPEINPVQPNWLKSGGELATIEAPDPYTVVYRFKSSYGMFLQNLASNGLQSALFAPKHYLKQFHYKYVPLEKLKSQARAQGMIMWTDLLGEKGNLEKNPELPTINPYKVVVPFPASRCLAVRNPYYWKVDPEGNQLPYIDEIAYTMVFDNAVLNLKASNGDVDFQMRRIDAMNFTNFMEEGPRRGYSVRRGASTNPTCVYINQYSRDETLRPILQDRRFRLALSHAINRSELIDMVYTGLAEPSNASCVPEDPYYLPGLEKQNIEYDPGKANQLLDELGMKRGIDGMRRLPNGKPFHQLLRVFPSEEGSNPEMWELVADYWREVGLQFTVKPEEANLSLEQVRAGNSDFWTYTLGGLHWAVDGMWKAPLQVASYYAPLYGLYFQSSGKAGVKPPPEHQQLLDWYQELRATPDENRRLELGRAVLKQWSEQCYVIGICRAPVLAIISDRFKNVPQELNYDYRLRSPGHFGIEQFYLSGEPVK